MEKRKNHPNRVDLLTLELRRARPADAVLIHSMQVRAFTPLMEVWHDHDTSPARETLEGIQAKLARPDSEYWLMKCGTLVTGCLRVVRREAGMICRLSPVFVLPEYQGQGLAHAAILLAERSYCGARIWELETLAQDARLCSLYEGLGYRRTGVTRALKPGLDLAEFRKET